MSYFSFQTFVCLVCSEIRTKKRFCMSVSLLPAVGSFAPSNNIITLFYWPLRPFLSS